MCPTPLSNGSSSGGVSRSAGRWSVAAWLVGALLVVVGAASLAIYAGAYDVAADIPQAQPVYWFLQIVRQRSIVARASDSVVPADLADPKRIASGAAQYDEMCSGCHLAPGMKRTEISQGLYPRAPELRRGTNLTPAEKFWVVKHGIKLTGMPAWGVTHDDELLWDVVACLQKLPELNADQYQALVKSASKTHEQMMQEGEMGTVHNQGDQPH